MVGWQFSFQMARFLVPVSLLDYTTEVLRPDVIAAFTAGNPPVAPGVKGLPEVIIGLWGGLLEGGKIGIERDTATGRVIGEITYP